MSRCCWGRLGIRRIEDRRGGGVGHVGWVSLENGFGYSMRAGLHEWKWPRQLEGGCVIRRVGRYEVTSRFDGSSMLHYHSQPTLWSLRSLVWSVMLIWKTCVLVACRISIDMSISNIIHTFAEHRNVNIAMLHPHRRCPGRDSLLTASAGE